MFTVAGYFRPTLFIVLCNVFCNDVVLRFNVGDPKSCLKLENPAAQIGTTMLTMLMNETTEWNRG